ncbi:MAG TPA: SgcJ/EcaC family oxidoreductase [Pirellulaceae bacterium]|nr:SgcJ/EcaC family oxidoreductase [Pirellulaceae bacterium]
MKRKLLLVVAAFLVAVAGTGWIVAQEKSKPGAKRDAKGAKAPAESAAVAAAARPEDEQAIKAASQAFAKAFETGDDKAVTALLTEGAEYIDEDGEPVRGREALAKAYGELFANRKQLQAESKTNAIRFLGADTAIEEGTFTVTTKDSSPNSSRFSTLYVRENGKWLIALLKEWQDDTTEKPSLKDLEWLIGTWESASDEVTARTTYSWTASKAFLRADYTITLKKGGDPSSGVQVIGVDPAVGNIRAWLFASDGGIGESTWIWEGDRWMIESVGTLADGTSTSAVNFLTRSGDDAFTWRSVQRIDAGEQQPDIAAVTVKRVAAAGGASPGAKGR